MSKPWDDLLPESLEVCGQRYQIRSDYRAMLDILTALADPELDDQDRGETVLRVFYPDFEEMPYSAYQEAIRQCFWFMNGGAVESTQKRPNPRLVDWEKDFAYIVSPINRVMGKEIRSMEYMHWWTFLAAYYEIGDCLFAQIVRIRSLKAQGKPLDKSDREWYSKNRELVDMETKLTERENRRLSEWML